MEVIGGVQAPGLTNIAMGQKAGQQTVTVASTGTAFMSMVFSQ